MPIDTRQKRFSMMAMASGCDGAVLNTLFEADGAVDQDDRQHLLDCYSGIAFASPSVADLMAMSRAMFRFVGNRVFGRVN